MKIKAKNGQYINKNNVPVFTYTIECTKEELKDYQESLGDKFHTVDDEPEGLPLYFSTRPLQVGEELHKTKKGTFTAYQDLENYHLKAEEDRQLAKFNAIMKFTGTSKAELQARLLSAF